MTPTSALRVLYVEDSPYDSDLTVRHFRAAAPHIAIETSPGMTDALARLAVGGFDLLLTDLRMSDGDGMQLLGAARELAPTLPVVLITGGGSTETAAAALRAGADDYVVKATGYLARMPALIEAAVARHAAERDRRATPIAVLLVEHDERDIELTTRHLGRAAPHIVVTAVRSLRAMRAQAAARPWDALLLDYRMPDGSTLDAVKALRDEGGFTAPVIIASGQGDEDVVARALRVGVTDYLVKTDGYLRRLPLALESAVYRARTDAARAALAESEARFHRFAENALDMIYRVRVRPALAVEYVNDAAARKLGATAPSLYDDPQRFFAGMEPAARGAFEAALEDPRGHTDALTVPLRNPDGSVFWTEHSLVAVTDRNGAVIAVEGIGRDVTERRRMEARLLQASCLEATGRLAGAVAHDVNNLITAVMGWADLARDALPEAHPTRDDLSSIQDASSRAAGVIRQLLAFAKMQPSEPCVIDVNNHVVGLTQLLHRLLSPSIRFEGRLAPRPLTVRIDPTQFEQVLVNLVINAREATPPGGVVVVESNMAQFDAACAELPEMLAAGNYVVLSVTDTGAGIAPDVLPHVFEPFFTTKQEGSGLGLATCYGIVTQNKGHISAFSEPGVGTTFKVYLPLVNEAAASWPPLDLTAEAPRGDQTVLVVDDDPGVNALMARALRRLGYVVLSATDGHDALTLAAAQPERAIDLVVADVVMPRLGGRALVEALTAQRPTLRALYVSAYPEGAIVAHRRLPDGAPFISKPFSALAFAQKIRATLDAPP